MTMCSDRFRLAVGFASALCLGASAVPQEVEPPADASLEHTRPRVDINHPWHMDLPSESIRRKQFGTCLVRFQVDPDGGVSAVQVVQPTAFPQLDHSCVQNVLHQTFLPGTNHGAPITEWITMPISINAKTTAVSERDTSGVPQIRQFFGLNTNLADYPAAAREIHQYKDCRIRLWVTPEAKVEKLEVTQSTGIAELDRACLSALEGAPFIAATRDGAAIGALAEITMRWTLR